MEGLDAVLLAFAAGIIVAVAVRMLFNRWPGRPARETPASQIVLKARLTRVSSGVHATADLRAGHAAHKAEIIQAIQQATDALGERLSELRARPSPTPPESSVEEAGQRPRTGGVS